MTTLQDGVTRVHRDLLPTEEADIDFFLGLWKQCVNPQQQRDLIKSFRNQMICAGAGEALTQS